MSYYIGRASDNMFLVVQQAHLCIFEGTDNIFYFYFTDEDGVSMDITDYTAEARITTSDGDTKSFTLTHVVGHDDQMCLTIPHTADFTQTEGAWFLNLIGPLSGDSKIIRKVVGNVVIIEETFGIGAPNYLLSAGAGLVLGTSDNTPIEVIV